VEIYCKIFRENINFSRKSSAFRKISGKVSEFSHIFAFRENVKRGFIFNPSIEAGVKYPKNEPHLPTREHSNSNPTRELHIPTKETYLSIKEPGQKTKRVIPLKI
jgi:hypothetical protein